MVDEAHGVGVLGARGAGACEAFGVEDQVDLRMGTFSKSLASCGGFIAGPAEVVEFLRIQSRAFLFTASAVPAAIGAALAAVRIMPLGRGPAAVRPRAGQRPLPERGLSALGFTVVEPTRMPDGTELFTPVVPVMVGDDWQAVLFWKALYDAGVYINVALYPAVPRGGALTAHERDGDARALAPRQGS